MNIRINDKTLDASLDNESTLGEVLASLEQWLSDSGNRISEIIIDEQIIKVSMIEEIFNKDIKTVNTINIRTNAIAELAAASIINLFNDINEYENMNFEEKANFFDKWNESPAAAFIACEIPDLYTNCVNTFSGGSMTASSLLSVLEEIQREVNEPDKELEKIEQILNEICVRLVDLPLDIQTGKDLRAAQTIQIFSAVTGKVFRIYRQLDIQGYLFTAETRPVCNLHERESKETTQTKAGKPLSQLITEYGNLLKELLEAYEKGDSVLVGDIAEYEASPKLKKLYSVIMERIHENTEKTDNQKTQGRI